MVMEDAMFWWALVIYVVVAYMAFSTVFTPVIALIVDQGVRKQIGLSKLIWNIVCILAANITLFIVALSSKLIFLLVCTLVGELLLWIILTNIIKKQTIEKFKNSFFSFYPIFKSRLKTFLLQPLFWLNYFNLTIYEIPILGLLKVLVISIVLVFPLYLRGPIITYVDNTVIKDDCAIIIPNMEISIKSISNSEMNYTNNDEKKWTFSVKGDGLYIPEGEYIFLCDFRKSESNGDKKYTYSVNDLEVIRKINKGKLYYLKYNLEKFEGGKFRVSLFFEEE
jgi:hypothetical protein